MQGPWIAVPPDTKSSMLTMTLRLYATFNSEVIVRPRIYNEESIHSEVQAVIQLRALQVDTT